MLTGPNWHCRTLSKILYSMSLVFTLGNLILTWFRRFHFFKFQQNSNVQCRVYYHRNGKFARSPQNQQMSIPLAVRWSVAVAKVFSNCANIFVVNENVLIPHVCLRQLLDINKSIVSKYVLSRCTRFYAPTLKVPGHTLLHIRYPYRFLVRTLTSFLLVTT